MRALKTIVFLAGFSLFQIISIWYVKTSVSTGAARIADIVLGLAFWLILWQLSSGGYNSNRGVGRWVQPGGLLRAFLIAVLGIGLGSWGLWCWARMMTRPYLDLARMSSAIEFFHLDYGTYPGKQGPISPSIYDELEGSSNAKINVKHIDFMKLAEATTAKDSYGNPFYFRIDPPNPKYPTLPNIIVISCGRNGKFENGQGDDLSFPVLHDP